MKILLILAAVAFCAYLERGNINDDAAQYCEMVSIWKSTHGAAGWPPYRGRCEVARAK